MKEYDIFFANDSFMHAIFLLCRFSIKFVL